MKSAAPIRDRDLPQPVPDSDLAGLDVTAAITRGLSMGGGARHLLFTDAAIAASIEAESLGIGPVPVGFLARFIRAGGVAAARRLPEPLPGADAAALARRWMDPSLAVAASGVNVDEDFARWLEMVAALMALRRSAGSAAPGRPAEEP
jgi:hypothetical protein